MIRSFATLIAATCLLTLAGCSTVPQTLPTRYPLIAPMPPVPRLLSADPVKPTAGDLFRLTVDLYEYAGECKRRLDAASTIK